MVGNEEVSFLYRIALERGRRAPAGWRHIFWQGKRSMNNDPQSRIDLDAYFARIDYHDERVPTVTALKAIHLGHATHIPFENLDVLLGRPIRIDLDSVQAKLVHRRRGGYCFEQNGLLAAVLEQLGFGVTRLHARVRWRNERVVPRTHVLLKVEAEGSSWLADVGFGSWGLIEPVPLASGEHHQFGWVYRVNRDGDLWALQAPQDGSWRSLYEFTLEPQLPVDFEPVNYYTSTHPNSRFTQTLVVQSLTPTTRTMLRDRELIEVRQEGQNVRLIENDEELLRVLAEYFGLVFPPGTRFRPRVCG